MVDSSERFWDEIWDVGAQESLYDCADTLLLAVLGAYIQDAPLIWAAGRGRKQRNLAGKAGLERNSR